MRNTPQTTTNLIVPPTGGNEIDQALLEELMALSDEELRMMGEEHDRARKESESVGEIPQDLKDFRKAWKNIIGNIVNDSKNKIIKAAETIPVKVETESDGSRLIEFKLGNKTYKILDPKLKTHSDGEYFVDAKGHFIRERNEWVKLGGMRGDDVTEWKNKKLAKYVKDKEKQGLHIAKIEEMKKLLSELGENAGLDKEEDQIAMLMYLTGMDGWYWLSMGDDESSGSQDSRSKLYCDDSTRGFNYSSGDSDYASLCMIACDDTGNQQEKNERALEDPIERMQRANENGVLAKAYAKLK